MKLKKYLEEHNKSVYWLKKRTKISHKAIYDMVNNKTTRISFETLGRICKELNCTPNDIIELDDDKN
ncbi:helix-turn-helix domain-containing protein [Clostridium saccharoperbutylacetonicum]|uniref:helix-turn-helix domain-containing protein n=1 Tax=Clostridium saccharoperbutylacetonicum TaxID=36745 RepID=UPI0039E8EC0A